MQVQSINNNYTPNFQANHLRAARGIINSGIPIKTEVDIFALNKNDTSFINRMLNAFKGNTFAEDEMAAGEGGVRSIVVNALKKALTLDPKSSDGVLLSVETRGKEKCITGVLDYAQKGDYRVDGFTVWNDNELKMSRRNLIAQVLRSKGRENNAYKNPQNRVDLMISTKEGSKLSTWLRKNGFNYEKQFFGKYNKDSMTVVAEKMFEKAKKFENVSKMQVDKNMKMQEVNLEEFLDLD